MRCVAFSPTQFWEAHNIHMVQMTFFVHLFYTFYMQKQFFCAEMCAAFCFKSTNTTLTSMQNMENESTPVHTLRPAHTRTHMPAFVQDRTRGMHLSADTYWRGSQALRLLYDISTAKLTRFITGH